MTTGLAHIANRLARSLGAYALSAAGQSNFALFSEGFANVATPAATIGANFLYVPTTLDPRMLIGVFNAECSAPNIEATITLLRNGVQMVPAGLVSVDSGGSADHNVQATLLGIDITPPVIGTAITYRLQGAVTAQTLAAVAGKGIIALMIIPLAFSSVNAP